MAFRKCASSVTVLDDEDASALVDAYDRNIEAGQDEKQAIKGAINELAAQINADKSYIQTLAGPRARVHEQLAPEVPVEHPPATGQPVDVNSEEFKRWYGESVVKDINGVPQVVYHGNNMHIDIEVFAPKEGRSFGGPFNEMGSWFTDNPMQASQFSVGITKEGDEMAGGTYPVYLKLENPKFFYASEIEDSGEFIDPWDKLKAAVMEYGGVPEDQRHWIGNVTEDHIKTFKKAMRDMGHDGVVLVDTEADAVIGERFGNKAAMNQWYITFEPDQIKSAIGNVGTYGVGQPNIYKGIHENYNNTFGEKGLFDGQVQTGREMIKHLDWRVADTETMNTLNFAVGNIGGDGRLTAPVEAELQVISDAFRDVIDYGMNPSVLDGVDIIAISENEEGSLGAYVPNSSFQIYGQGSVGNVLYFRRNVIVGAVMGDEAALKVLRNTVAHEMGHAVGIDFRGNDSAWDSPALRLDPFGIKTKYNKNKPYGATLSYSRKGGVDAVGPVIRELLTKVNTKKGVELGLTKFFGYPLNDLGNLMIYGSEQQVWKDGAWYMITVDDNFRTDYPEAAADLDHTLQVERERIQSEIFAQIHALYYTRRDLLREHLPKAYKLMQEIEGSVQKSTNIVSIGAGVRAALRSQGERVSYADPRSFGQATTGGGPRGFGPRQADTGVRAGPSGQPSYPQQQAALRQAAPDEARPWVKQRVDQVGAAQATQEARRGVRTHEATRQAAQQLGVTPERLEAVLRRAYGKAYNAEQIKNTAMLLDQKGTELAERSLELLNKMEDGRATDREIAEVMNLIEEATPLGAQFLGVSAEAGRALNILNTAGNAKGLAQALTAKIDNTGGRDVLIERLRIIASSQDSLSAVQHAAEVNKITVMDKMMEYYRAMLLTGVPTHVVNMISNGMMQVLNDVDYAFAMGVGKVLGSEDAITLSEYKARIAGYTEGVRLGLTAAYEQLKDEDADISEVFGLDITKNKIDAKHKHAIKGFKGKLVRIPYRLLGAGDAVWKGIAYGKSMRGEAQRLIDAGDTRSVDQILKEATPEMIQRAQDEADLLTFTNEAGDFTRSIMRGVRQHPSLGVLIPFIRTPSNIIKVALKHSPAAVFWTDVKADIRAGGRKRDLAIARILTGSSIGAMAWGLAAAGLITGQPPEDPNERRLWLKEKQANSFRMGNDEHGNPLWVSYSRFEPFGMLLGIAADMYTLADRMETDEIDELGSLVISSITSNLTNKTYLKGLSEFVAMVNDPERYGKRYLQKMGATIAVPVFFSYTAKATDDRLRRAETLLDHIKARLPVARQTLPERLDVFGQPIMEQGSPIYRFLSPAYLKRAQGDPVGKELLNYDVRMSMPSRKYQGVELKDHGPEVYNSLVEALGKPTYEVLKRVIKSGAYKSMNPADKQWMLQKVIDRVRGDARKYWAYSHPAIMEEARQRKLEKRYTLQ